MITITALKQIGLDERGGTYVFDTTHTGEFMMTQRKKGSSSGRHYHNGVSPNKNPEQLILMSGSVTLNWRNMRGPENGSVDVQAPARIAIPAGVYHEVIALEDFVMLELNSTADGQGDTVWPSGSRPAAAFGPSGT
jgi:hypothetical protein